MTILNYKSIHSTKRQFFLNCSIIILLCFILLRWFLLIDRYSVNMLFWDQWDFLGALFDSKGPWDLFSWQHGPHRQGIGFFLTKIVADCSGWNTRVESFMIGIVVCLAALTAAFLKLRLVGKITALDIFIALLYLTPLQFGLVANTPNVSHGAMPLLLITLFCLCWTIDGITLRYVLCAIINFMEIYTGFGIFLGCITPILFLSELYLARKRKQTGNMFLAILFFFIALASVLSFFIDYTFCPAAKGFTFPYPQPLMYAEYIIIALGAFCGIRGSHIASMSVGFPAACCMIYIIIKAAASIVRDASNRAMKDNIVQRQIILVLVTFTLTFSLNLAIGRVCLGLETATASRYTPYITPAFFALYLFSTTRKDVPKRLIIFSIVCFFVTTFSIGNHNRAYAERLCQGKLRWKQAYLQTENIHSANRISGFAVHPNPSRTHLKRKLDYLKEHRLNLYLPSRE